MAKGLTAAKAKKILEDGKVRGKALTEKQKKFFGAVAGGATPLKKLNGGWLDKFAMGGNLPGASGMMYARTSGTSPEKPKKAQDGKVWRGTPEYEAAYEEGRFADVPNPLEEVVVTAGVDYEKYPLYDKLSAQQKEYFNDPGPIGRGVRRAAQTNRGLYEDTLDVVNPILYTAIGSAGLMSPLGRALGVSGRAAAPYISRYALRPIQRALNYKPLGGPVSVGNVVDVGSAAYAAYATPEAYDKFKENPSFDTGTDLALTAVDLVPFGEIFTGGKNIKKLYNKGKNLFTNDLKPNPNMYYRGIGQSGLDDITESGLLRAKPADKIPFYGMGTKFDFAKRFKNLYVTPRLGVAQSYGKGVVAEIPKDVANFSKRYKNTDWSMSTNQQIPIEEVNLYKKNFFGNYKPVNIPQSPISDMPWIKPNIYPTSSPLPKNMEPYLSRKVYPFNKEQEIFESFLPMEAQLKNIDLKSIRYDADGNIIPNMEYGGEIDKAQLGILKAAKNLYKSLKASKSLKNFKSEIDWAKWNKEIPDNKALMQEYNAIEQQAKANGTWMKNPDGSAFQGTPEQFVQQNSENFKKAFPNALLDDSGSPLINYHGSGSKFDTFDESKFYSGSYGKGVYTSTDKEAILRSYANPDKKRTKRIAEKSGTDEPTMNLYELYINAKNPLTTDDILNYRNFGKTVDELPSLEDWKNSDLGKRMIKENAFLKTDEDIMDFIKMNFPNNPVKETYINEGGDFLRAIDSNLNEGVTPFGNPMKSAVGNNGMFDMTNPNIYKAIIPGAIGIGAASQIGPVQEDEQFKNGGEIDEAQWGTLLKLAKKYGSKAVDYVKGLRSEGKKVANTANTTGKLKYLDELSYDAKKDIRELNYKVQSKTDKETRKLGKPHAAQEEYGEGWKYSDEVDFNNPEEVAAHRKRWIDSQKKGNFLYQNRSFPLFDETSDIFSDLTRYDLNSFIGNSIDRPFATKLGNRFTSSLGEGTAYTIGGTLNPRPQDFLTHNTYIRSGTFDKASKYDEPLKEKMDGEISRFFNNLYEPKTSKIDFGDLLKNKNRNGGVIEDDRGQWAHPGKVTKINSNNITMKGINYPVLGISDTGDTKMMQPGKDYKFKGNSVTEFPMARDGKSLVELNQLTNFTNYNTPQPGGWLDKYH